ncbi:hypothetical protein ISN45_At02g005790 [Arabidopsis thaliana x Arabidopsis arenosa]|uniref:Uncharacterized protein n=1 Tax=Arabidopsis thaliana x Arabidopsis arenosa TaxID=1240361 RepID=A0A8T2FJ21_9BRAS|nr:hypothetical protein ISN45_At02g005790 [Arabidopsis thaliana x Arabidopsis arenosa]
MESEYELVKIEESDNFAVAEAVSNDTNPWCRSTPSHIYETSGCDEAESTKLDIDLQNHSKHIDSVDRHLLGVDRHQYQPEEVSTFDGAESTEIDRAGSIPYSSVDRYSPTQVSIDTTTRVDRHTFLVEEESSPIATFQVGITAVSPSTTVTSRNAPLILHPPPKRLRYSSPPPKPPDIINKTLKFPKTILRLSKPRVSRRALVLSVDDYAGKRSIPPILEFHPADAPLFLDRPNTLIASTPVWMMRGLSPRYLLPPSDPPDPQTPPKLSY